MIPDKIFGLFYMYGIMIALGIICCFAMLFWYGKKKKIDANFIDFIFYIAVAAIVIGFGSATLFQALYDYIQNPAGGFDLSSGMTFIGGLIGGVVVFLSLYFIFRKKFTTRLVDIISFLPCCILIAHAFGRVGCFFAGCCYGKPTDSFLGVQFPHLSYKVHPTQLYEAIFLFALCAVCFWLIIRKNFKHNLSVYLTSYGVFRFCLEFLRGDDRGQFLGTMISPSQFWSICMVIAGVGVYFLLEWAYKKRAAELANAVESEGVSEEQSEGKEENAEEKPQTEVNETISEEPQTETKVENPEENLQTESKEEKKDEA